MSETDGDLNPQHIPDPQSARRNAASSGIAEGDPTQVPIRDAATVMIVADQPELQVLMVRRNPRSVFAPSAWVFPGGRVDPGDRDLSRGRTLGVDDASASQILGLSRGGAGWWVAAVRETFEESGLLLGTSELTAAQRRYLISATQDRQVHLSDAAAAAGLGLDVSAMPEVARFVTPVGPPRRFDTRFFLATTPAGQEVVADENEIVDFRWVTPGDGLEMATSGEMPMISVTYRMLACLSRYDSASAVLNRAQQRLPGHRVRVVDPTGEYRVVLPGEPGYETAELEVEHGWVRI